MTPGELARLFRDDFGVEAELTVVPMANWRAGDGLRRHRPPLAPSLPQPPDLESAFTTRAPASSRARTSRSGAGRRARSSGSAPPGSMGSASPRRSPERGFPASGSTPARFVPEDPGDAKFDRAEVRGCTTRGDGSGKLRPDEDRGRDARPRRGGSPAGGGSGTPPTSDRLAGSGRTAGGDRGRPPAGSPGGGVERGARGLRRTAGAEPHLPVGAAPGRGGKGSAMRGEAGSRRRAGGARRRSSAPAALAAWPAPRSSWPVRSRARGRRRAGGGAFPVPEPRCGARSPGPFGPGEQAEYEVTLGPFSVGGAIMQVVTVEPVRSRPSTTSPG